MALPKLEDWKAPWEVKGEDFDEESARKYIYTLTSDKEKLQGRVTAAQGERDEAKKAVEDVRKELEAAQAKGDNADVVKDLQAKVAKAEERATTAERKALQYEVAADKEIPLTQAKRLQGTTKEELEADAEEFAQSFGSTAANTGDGDEDDDEENGVPRRTPRRLTNPVGGGGGDEVIDIEKAIASIPRL